jgi:DNA polymerase III epsilon subunit family exonuclease
MMKKRLIDAYKAALLDDVVVFDLETTGLFPSSDDIIQVAAVRILNGHIRRADSFFSYVKAKTPLDPFIVGLTGITDRRLKSAPPAPTVLREFSHYCGDSLLVAHNGHRFDIPFLENACVRFRLPTRRATYFDSIALSRAVWRERGRLSHSLDSVLSRLRVRRGTLRRHDARGDVSMLAECVVKMCARLKTAEGLDSVPLHESCLPRVVQK